jgi:UTP--glucose-1-phosphate uridylyltransferase
MSHHHESGASGCRTWNTVPACHKSHAKRAFAHYRQTHRPIRGGRSHFCRDYRTYLCDRTQQARGGDHFDANLELENQLLAAGKKDVRDMVRNIVPKGVSCIFVRQPEPLGLGHAVLCAAPAVGNNPFVVLLADDLMRGPVLPTQALVQAFRKHPRNLLSVSEVPLEDVSKYGIVRKGTGALEDDGLIPVAGLVEKPATYQAPSQLASFGRYAFLPEVFTILRDLPAGAGGEIQLADAIDILAVQGKVAAIENPSRRYDCGSKFGYLTAIVDAALEDPIYTDRFEALLQERLARGAYRNES